VLLAIGLIGSAVSTEAVLFHATSDPSYNTNAPSGTLTNSGWQFQGLWGNFLGTPIGPRHFVTAKHLGGVSVGDPFWFEGARYDTTAAFPDSQSDLQIWRVCSAFPRFAPLYPGTNEIGQALVVFGRGTQRGAPVTTDGTSGTKTNGWLWVTPPDHITRWGQNTVSDIFRDPSLGDLLQAEFNANGGPNECHLSIGDSGGAVFIQDDGIWKLAGINYSVDGPYNTVDSGAGFNAALFDQGGLYYQDGTNWVWTPDRPREQPGTFYATRVSSHVAWINSILAQPIPDTERVVLQLAEQVTGLYADDSSAVVDESARTVTLPQPAGPRFYRLRACTALRMTSILRADGDLVLRYEAMPSR
jgi:hypothetical protein